MEMYPPFLSPVIEILLKSIAAFILLLTASLTGWGQHVANLPQYPTAFTANNINIQKLASDSLCTAFLIDIQEGVQHHFHTAHTENIYIISGSGTMGLGDSTFSIAPGDYILIPRNTIHNVLAQSPLRVLSIQTPEWKVDDRKFVDPIRRP